MTRHVDYLLAQYVEGQLAPEKAAEVYRHTATCHRCRGDLARRERMARKLQNALRGAPRPQEARVQLWWHALTTTRSYAAHNLRAERLLAATLATIFLILPIYGASGLLAGNQPLFSAHIAHTPAAQVTARLMPDAPELENAPVSSSAQNSTAVATIPPAPLTGVRFEPAPLAPTLP